MKQPTELPVPLATLVGLFRWLRDKPCDTTLHNTMTFLRERNMLMEQQLSFLCWLEAHGHCDCEILLNIACSREIWRALEPR